MCLGQPLFMPIVIVYSAPFQSKTYPSLVNYMGAVTKFQPLAEHREHRGLSPSTQALHGGRRVFQKILETGTLSMLSIGIL